MTAERGSIPGPEITNLPGGLNLSQTVQTSIGYSADESRSRGLGSVGTEELLLGALRAFPGTFESLSLNPYALRDEILKILPEGVTTGKSLGETRLTPRAVAAIQLAQSEADNRGEDETIDEYDYLLGLGREGEGIAAGILEWFDASPRSLRPRIERLREQGHSQTA